MRTYIYAKKQLAMPCHYKQLEVLFILWVFGAMCHEPVKIWDDSEGGRFHPSYLHRRKIFQPAISNARDLQKESYILSKGTGHSFQPVPAQLSASNLRYPNMGYLYNIDKNQKLGFRKGTLYGYDSVLGFGEQYKKALFSIYNIDDRERGAVVLLSNDKKLTDYLIPREPSTMPRPLLERVPGLINNNGKVEIKVGPISAKSFKLIGISAFFKNYNDRAKKSSSLPHHLQNRQEFVVKSSLSEAYIAFAGENQPAVFKSQEDCQDSYKSCTFIWVPYEEML